MRWYSEFQRVSCYSAILATIITYGQCGGGGASFVPVRRRALRWPTPTFASRIVLQVRTSALDHCDPGMISSTDPLLVPGTPLRTYRCYGTQERSRWGDAATPTYVLCASLAVL